MRILCLEDNPIRIEAIKQLFKNQDIIIVDNVKEAKELSLLNDFKVLLLDHDLGGQIWVDPEEENTGYSFVKWLVENNLCRNSLIYIHSLNPIGANKMLNYLLDNGYDGIWHPFHLWRV